MIQTKEQQYQKSLKKKIKSLKISGMWIRQMQRGIKKCKKQMAIDFEFKKIFKEMNPELYKKCYL